MWLYANGMPRRAKLKKRITPITYPIVGLLALLDHASLLKHPNLTESITSLLALIGRPLTVLVNKSEEAKNQPAGTSTSIVPVVTLNQASTVPATTNRTSNCSAA